VDAECVLEPKLLASSNYKISVEHVLPIKFAELVERKIFLGNVSRIKKPCHKNVIPRLHFRVAGSFQWLQSAHSDFATCSTIRSVTGGLAWLRD
jgi:hypothetical protein